MPNNNKLSFNPLRGLDSEENIQNQSVPTTASDYLNINQQNNNQFKIDWNPQAFKQAADFVNWNITTSPEEKDKALNVMSEIDKWDEGLSGLSDEDRKSWEYQNFQKIRGKDDEWKDRLWRNQQFISKFGLDAFKSNIPEERDKFYEDYITSDAVAKKFSNDKNLQQLLELTPEGKKELLKSNYLPEYALHQADIDAEEKDWNDYTLKERWNASRKGIGELGYSGVGVGSVVGGIIGGAPGTIVGAAIGGVAGATIGIMEGVINPSYGDEFNAQQRRKDNEDILSKITAADNERKKEQSSDEIDNRFTELNAAYQKGLITSEQIESTFDDIALNGKKGNIDEFGNSTMYDYQGSSYYSAFKDSDEFEHFDTVDKLKYIAQTEVLNSKYGQNSAIQVLDQDMQNYVSDNQTGWTWLGNTLKNVWVGGVANMGMKVTALGALGARLVYGEEGLANYLKGKDASGSGEDNWAINNPQYWNKVDQYNDLGIDMSWLDSDWTNHFNEAEQNGGMSTATNVTRAGQESNFWSWNTLNEAVRMNKFAWSDLLTNIALGKIVRTATRAAGGVELAPGVLASESTAASKFINRAGSLGVLNASSLGIDAAYGMQTYEEVLRKNNERLDNIIDEDVRREVERRLAQPRAREEFENYVRQENRNRQLNSDEVGRWIPVNEERAWEDYTAHIEKEVRNEQEALHAEDRQQAEIDAANAYMIDASIEHLRMATTNGVFKSYLFDKGTLNALRGNSPYVGTTTKSASGMYALEKNASKKYAMRTFGMNVWGGFHSNYFDDVTVGLAEGFGIQDYNNYLLQKYNPAAYGSVLDDYVNPFVAGMLNARNAMTEKRSLLDGAIGALGTGFTLMPNIGGILSHKERMKEAADAAKRSGKDKVNLSWQEVASDYINNPILQAFADAKAATRRTEAEIERRNNQLKENAFAFDHMVETLSSLNQKAATREGTSMLDAEDAKDREAFTLASTLVSLKNSDVVANAQAEPDKANWSRKKKAGHIIARGINALMGNPMFEEAESSYTRAMQTLQDAATLGENVDAETQQRQQELVETFIGLDANKNVLKGMSQEEQIAFAQERLKKNASSLLNVMDRTEKLQKQFDKSLGAQLYPSVKQQLLYQYVLDGRWKIRRNEIEQWIRKDENLPDSESTSNVIAKYGSHEGHERVLNAQKKRVEDAQKELDKATLETKKENDPTKSIAENARIKASRLFNKQSAEDNLKKEQARLKSIEQDAKSLEDAIQGDAPVIQAEQILRLNADERLRMLDDFYRNDYSEAQQREIDRAKNLLIEDGTSIGEAMEKVKDAAILTHRIEDNMEVAKKIMQNPIEANMLQQSLIENRKRAVIDYFNDKIIAEAFNDFANDYESTISEDKVAEKAEGYSTAVLNGMLREIEKQTASNKRAHNLSDKILSIMEDGIKRVLNVRDEKLRETSDLDKFIRKTKKVNHTETIRHYLIDGNTGEVDPNVYTEEQETTEKELSSNDKNLLEAALDYAAERGITIDDLSNETTKEDFDKYLQERNHAYQLSGNGMGEVRETNVGIAENRINPVSLQYLSNLIDDVVKAFKKNQTEVKQSSTDKVTSEKSESVATKPVEPGESKVQQKEEEVRPDEVNPANPLGIKRSTEQANAAEENISEDNENSSILSNASILNSGILEGIEVLLKELDKMQMDERTRKKLKDIIDSNVSSRAFGTINQLQNKIMEDAMTMGQVDAPQLDMKATALSGLNIENIKGERNETITESSQNNPPEDTQNPLPSVPLSLETRDLDKLMNYPIWEKFIKDHNIVGFLQKLSALWNKEYELWKETKLQGTLHQSQVVFIYDPALAQQIKNSIEEDGGYYNPEISSPILMALEITEKNKNLVDDESQLLSIKDKTDNTTKRYQVIGIMPASEVSTGESAAMRGTADRMGALRSRINYDDSEAHVLRYAPQSNTGKYNGSIIKTNIEKVSSHTEEDRIPHATEQTPRTNVQQLMDENLNSATESFVKTTSEETQEYNEAKQRGLPAVRKTSLYKKLRKAFIDRLVKRVREGATSDDADSKELNFKLQKGTSDNYPKIVLIKKIGDTQDKNSGRPIVDLLREIDDAGSNAQEVIESNSRFKRLFNQIAKLQLPKSLFNQQGQPVNRTSYIKELADFADSVKRAIDNNLHVDDLSVKVEVSEGVPSQKIVYVKVYSGDSNNVDNLLSVLSFSYTGQISQAEYASFLKDLILENGNTRPGLNNSSFERVKWQVNYEDAETANDKTKSSDVRKAATDNMNDLYDDGIFEMQVSKLAYPSRSVTAAINPLMRSRLYPERRSEVQTPVQPVTETKASHEVESTTGKIDGDTGMRTETPSKESIVSSIPRLITDTIKKMISNSEQRDLTDDRKHYSIANQLWSRVTSIKYTLEGMMDRFNPQNDWALPSTAIGDSLDSFARDVFNGVFDSMTNEERKAAFETYDNSTEKNYSEVYMRLKAFEARLREKGQVIVQTGDKENPGKITAKGILNVIVKTSKGTETRKVRAAGTLDLLTVDSDGNLHIYDFKTHRGREFSANDAEKKGYDRQLSMYAKFLEDEYGLKVKSINIIPVKVDYPTPSGKDNDGNSIKGAQKTYKKSSNASNQLLVKDVIADDTKFEPFNGANFQVENEFKLTRLTGNLLDASYEKMTDDEKKSIVEAIHEQNDNVITDTPRIEDLVETKPEQTQSEISEEDEGLGFSLKGKRFGKRKSRESVDTSTEGTAEAINPNDRTGLRSRLEELERACGGKRRK